ncbi:conserved hypothetical protein [Gluconacetobacter diazotrophicus PA1 5]|nr:SGNH/GDSL hydrolase family protein [Gluconacetobacter diazotrophicus]ACI50537.1 conserved hypothetical protein [Gluconacetobacter diazotrophicus PA1 5]MBB2155730.1 SGNH/GDSL hydrolase family protein [Gluconacetobacter diazotrophicus]
MAQVSMTAFVSDSEQPAVACAADFLTEGLRQEGTPLSCTMVASMDDLPGAPADSIRLSSLVPWVETLDTPWPVLEQQIRQHYATLCAGGAPVLIATVFRHVGPQADPDRSDVLLVRIRRLNLLAAELSREYGAFVIDLDRIFADIGALRLETDYRLDGAAARELAGHAVALGIVDNGLDAVLPYEAQERVKAVIAARRPATRPPPEITPRNMVTMGKGRRRQVVSTITDTDQENQVGRLIRLVMKRQMDPAQAMEKLVHAVRKRGVQESLGLLTTGVIRAFGAR